MGELLIGMEVANSYVPGKTMFLWHKAGPLFDQFRKGSESKARIKAVDDMVGFGELRAEDRAELEELVRAEGAFWEGLSEAEEVAAQARGSRTGSLAVASRIAPASGLAAAQGGASSRDDVAFWAAVRGAGAARGAAVAGFLLLIALGLLFRMASYISSIVGAAWGAARSVVRVASRAPSPST